MFRATEQAVQAAVSLVLQFCQAGLAALCVKTGRQLPLTTVVNLLSESRHSDVLECRAATVGTFEINREHLVLCVACLRGGTVGEVPQ
jgi:hypothetical protein